MTHITVISDTHMRHGEVDLPGGDLLIHCGDIFNLGYRAEAGLKEVDDWFGSLRYRLIVCVGGNHDSPVEAALREGIAPFSNARMLCDEQLEFDGLKLYGSPWVPGLPSHAFSKDGSDLSAAWTSIPRNLDVLITHTPAKGVLDLSSRGVSHGCPMLLECLESAKPAVHCFGHVHAAAGRRHANRTLSINASNFQRRDLPLRPPTHLIAEEGDRGFSFKVVN